MAAYKSIGQSGIFEKVVGEIPDTKAAHLKKSLLNLPNPRNKAMTHAKS